jgi:hypothetical protein
MNFLECIAKAGCFLDSTVLYTIIILFGLIFTPYKAAFTRTVLLLSFTIIYNLGLKSIWQIPLLPPLEGWAFPSGHMHAAVVFWGWLAIEVHRAWFTKIVLLFLCIISYGLIYYFYHYPIDVVGAAAFGSFSLFLFWILNRLPYFHHKAYRLGYLLSPVAITIFIAVHPYFGHKVFLWIILSTLILTTLLSRVFKPQPQPLLS